MMGITAHATPAFNAVYANGNLSAIIGVDGFPTDYNFPTGIGSPVSASITASGISSTITETAPYELAGQYWAGSWHLNVTADAGAGGLFGVVAQNNGGGLWGFSIDGLTPEELAATTFYYAVNWSISADPSFRQTTFGTGGPFGLGATLYDQDNGIVPAGGTMTGSFLNDPPAAGFEIGLRTIVLPGNAAGSINIDYQIAFSTTPIDASVFSSPPASVPDSGGTLLLAGMALAGMTAVSARQLRVCECSKPKTPADVTG